VAAQKGRPLRTESEPYWRSTLRKSWRAFRWIAPLLLVAMGVRAVVMEGDGVLSLLTVGIVLAALAAGSVAFGLISSLRSDGAWNPLAWTVAGAIAVDSMVGLVFTLVPADPYGGDALLVRSPLFWGFWTVAGALTGFSYWMISRSAQ